MSAPAKLVSPNPTCRRVGCQETVPYYGGYPGLPQSHCYRCGMKTGYAAADCADFVEPICPHVDLNDRIKAVFSNRIRRLYARL